MKKILLGLSIVLMVLFSGCITVTYDSKVNSSGGIEKHDMTLEMSSSLYSLLNSMAEEEGKSLKESVISQGGEYEELWDGDDVKIIVKGLPPENVSIEKSEDYIVYRDSIDTYTEDDEYDMDGAVKIHYYLEMPNEIIDSNADSVKGKKAEWHMVNSSSMRDVYAKCETPSSLPGIGLLNAIAILLIVVLISKRSHKN